MTRISSLILLPPLCMAIGLAQDPPPATAAIPPEGTEPIYHVNVVSRTTVAINYGHRTDPTKIDFQGTVLLPQAHGEATVQSKRGTTDIDAKFERVDPPTKFGTGYLTYVLWAITPEGRPVNLGELVPNSSNKGKLHVSTDLQSFALIVTAEPYYSVTQPSDVVVLENVIRPDTVGKVEEVNARYELLPRKGFTFDPSAPVPNGSGQKLSMDQYEAVVALYQAQNAIQIARVAGADHYAPETFQKAQQLYRNAQYYRDKKADSKTIVMTAREAAQAAEDARTIASRRQQHPQ